MNIRLAKYTLLACAVFFCSSIELQAQVPKKVTAHEITLRKKATKLVVPKYPQKAIKRAATGPAIAEILISEEGNVLDVKILESPHESISVSMTDALKQWKFSPFTIKGQPQRVTGKITYYFTIQNRTGKVEAPF